MADDVGFTVSDGISGGIDRATKALVSDLEAVTKRYAEITEQSAKDNAPWNDRTGQAREGLVAEGLIDGHDAIIALGHTVDYGLWLEVRWSGRYAIVMPTLEEIAPQYKAALQRMGA